MDRQRGSSQPRRMIGVLAILAAGAGVLYAAGRREEKVLCRIAHVLAYNQEFSIGTVAFGPSLPDTVTLFSELLAPPYPGGVFCTQVETEP